MVLALLWAGILASTCVSKFFSKKNSQTFAVGGLGGPLVYTVETSLFSLFFFWMFNGFSLSVNFRTCIYAFFYAIIVIIGLVIGIYMFRFGSFAFISFFRSALTLVASMILGRLAFSEAITPDRIVRVVLLLFAAGLLFFSNLKKSKRKAGNNAKGEKLVHPLGVLFVIATSVLGCGSTYIVKRYSLDTGVGDSNSLLFMTNFFSAFLGALILLVYILVRKGEPIGIKKIIVNKNVFNSLFTTLNSNLCSLMTVVIVGMMDVAVYTPVSSAFGFVAVALVAPIIKEKLDKYTVIATIIAVLSVFLPELIW